MYIRRWAAGRLHAALTAACTLLACGEPRTRQVHPSLANAGFLVVAHRGGAGLDPEGTLMAFRNALEQGADVLEMDVRSTADGALVVCHDARVDRLTEGTGRVDSLTLAQLQGLDAGYRWQAPDGTFPHRGQGVRVPTLAEVLQAFPQQRLVVEIKDGDARAAEELCRTLRAGDALGRVVVASFGRGPVQAFRRACPEAATAGSGPEVTWFWLLQRLRLDRWWNPSFAVFQVPEHMGFLTVVDRRFVERAHAHGLPVQVWTVDHPEQMERLLDLNVDGLMTDFPDRLRRVLHERGAR